MRDRSRTRTPESAPRRSVPWVVLTVCVSLDNYQSVEYGTRVVARQAATVRPRGGHPMKRLTATGFVTAGSVLSALLFLSGCSGDGTKTPSPDGKGTGTETPAPGSSGTGTGQTPKPGDGTGTTPTGAQVTALSAK